jgi:prepilin-type processing-associated H-X9-DG protein
VLFLNSSIRLKDIVDGKANTLLIGEHASSAVFPDWYRGCETTLRYSGVAGVEQSGTSSSAGGSVNQLVDPNQAATGPIPPQQFGSLHDGGTNFALADGAVRFIPATVDREILRRLGNRRDGMVVGSF